MEKTKKSKFWKRISLVVISLISVLVLVFFAYVNMDVYSPSTEALQLSKGAKVINNDLYFESNSNVGLIFYPGGKVDHEAYSYLGELSNYGVNVFIVDMPFRLAMFDVDAADDLIQNNPKIEHWYIAGHSLGGTSASMYVEKHADQIDGIIYLAAYPASDLSDLDLPSLAIFGENDGLITEDKRNEKIKLLPSSAQIEIIAGGNHGQFGDYGKQKKDREATISLNEQHEFVINRILSFIQK